MGDASKLRVLLMETHSDARTVFVQLLTDAGYIVRDFDSPEGALTACSEFEPNVLLVDISSLGAASCTAFAHRMRTCMAPRGCLIAMALDLTPALVTVAFDAVVLKPFQMERIDTLIRAWFATEQRS